MEIHIEKKKNGFLTNTKGLQRYTYGNPRKNMSSSTMILQTPYLGRLPSRSNQLPRTYVVQVSNIRRRVLHVSDASSRPTTKHLWPSKCVVQGKSIYAKYSTFITPDTRGLCLGYNWAIRSIDSFPHSFPRLVAIIYL